MRDFMLTIWRSFTRDAQAEVRAHDLIQSSALLELEYMLQSKIKAKCISPIAQCADDIAERKLENISVARLNAYIINKSNEAIAAKDRITESTARDVPEMLETLVSIGIPNLFMLQALSGINNNVPLDMRPLEICIDAALAGPNHARTMAELCTPGMLLGNAVENSHHLGMAFARSGLEGIEDQKKIAEDYAQATAEEMDVQDQSEVNDFLDTADFCAIM